MKHQARVEGQTIHRLTKLRSLDDPREVLHMAHVAWVAATDNYLCLSDMANERVTVLKLNYDAEATAPVQ